MPDYSIFGSCLRSEIAFPELRKAINAAPRWRLEISRQRHPPVGTALLGTDDIGGGVAVRVYKLPGGGFPQKDDKTPRVEGSPGGGPLTRVSPPHPGPPLGPPPVTPRGVWAGRVEESTPQLQHPS